ncbi:MAG: nuclear transport factor 2 family protein [Betaproteobacteria bacterium]|nr:nuclear transport factor 2 family protein [Betaproteobacteria bacterium]
MDFTTLLHRFTTAVAARDCEGFAALFTPEGCYDDGFFGAHHGRADIAAMLARFHVGGEDFFWEFLEPLQAGDLAYARYRFSYRSREPESAGQLIMFDGIARFRLRDGLIHDYTELFDRGVAFVQLGYATPRVRKLIDRYAAALRDGPACAAHMAAREARAKTS